MGNYDIPEYRFDGNMLFLLRQMNHCSQIDFASILDISTVALSNIENENCLPSFRTLVRLMIVLGYSNPSLTLDQFNQTFFDYLPGTHDLPRVPLLDKGYALSITS